MDKKEQIINRLHEIDQEIESLHEIKTRSAYNFVKDAYVTRSIRVPKDPYRIRDLRNQKSVLLKQLDALSESQIEERFHDESTRAIESPEGHALSWGVEKYMENMAPKRIADVKKSRPIAREAVAKYFPGLKGTERERRIDAMRDQIANGVKQLMSTRRPNH